MMGSTGPWTTIIAVVVVVTEKRIRDKEQRRQKRKDRESSASQPGSAPSILCPNCNILFRAKIGLISHLEVKVISACGGRTICAAVSQEETPFELPPQDGFFNNLDQPNWGIVGSRLLRKGRPGYSDGVYEMAGQRRPSPLDLSLHVHNGQGGTASDFGRNALVVFFAQLVLDEILSTGQPGCPPEYSNLPLPDNHPLRNRTNRPMVYQRSAYDQRTGYSPNTPRQQTNGVTSFLDGGVIYGTSRTWTSHLRAFKNGEMLADGGVLKDSFPSLNSRDLPMHNAPVPRDHALKPVSRLFGIGNAKGHETPFLLSLQVVWHRYHNKLAADLKQQVPSLSDQRIFDLARKRVIATFQHIAVNEWLSAFLNGNTNRKGVLPPYTGYKPDVRPEISHEFRTAMNFRYLMMPSAVWTIRPDGSLSTTQGRGPGGESRNVTSLRLCNNFWDSQTLVQDHLDSILRGMLRTFSEKEDHQATPDLRESYYGPFEYSRQDVVAMEIQRDRDHGVGDLNTVLKEYGLQPANTWADLGAQAQSDLQSLYPANSSQPNDVDLFTGAVMSQGGQGGFPSLFRDITIQQFTRIRDSDRFWFENENNGLFSTQELAEIRNTSFSDILQQTTNLLPGDLTARPFICRSQGQPRCLSPPTVADDTDPTVDVCVPLQTYDYVTGSEWSFALSFLALFLVLPGSVLVLKFLAYRRQRYKQAKAASRSKRYQKKSPNKYRAREWQGEQSGERNVTVEFDSKRKKVMVRALRGKELRFIDLRNQTSVNLKTTHGQPLMSLALEGEGDLVLNFEDSADCVDFVTALTGFLQTLGLRVNTLTMTEAEIKGGCVSRDERQAMLDVFFRVICLQAMSKDDSRTSGLDPARVDTVVNVRLTRTEFAEALGMQPSSIFVRNIFLLADSNRDGFVSFHEFLSLFAVFLKGSAQEKARLMFNVYDVRRQGVLTKDDFSKMVKSLLELSENAGDLHDDSALTRLVDVMFRDAGIDKDVMTYDDFCKVFASKEYASTLQAATLSGQAQGQGAAGAGEGKSHEIAQRKSRIVNSYRKKKQAVDPRVRRNVLDASEGTDDNNSATKRRSRIRVSTREKRSLAQTTAKRYIYSATKWVEVYRWQIFWVTLYTLVTCGIFVERAYFYAVGREHAGLRRVSGSWTTAMIRGSASVIMFTYASLLLTMCRNLITRLRETVLHRFVPFDSAVAFHKYIAAVAMMATIVHIVGHGVNLYCMCTQSTTNINCFFREYFTSSTGFAVFHYWAFQTITGLAGVLVTAVIFVMHVFAVQWARRRVFAAFWLTHSLYPLVYVLTFLHGVGRLVQDPLFPWYLMGPLVIFVLDRLVSASRNRIEIPVLEAELLPSDVIKLVFKRPSNLAYKSGQWVRIACIKLGKQEYHPFTLTSAPHERHLSLHIRAVGPWTSNLRNTYDRDVVGGESYPKLYLDGPFGEGHQDWYSCDVAVLVGGGIGITPFASILKDIAFKSRTGALITCQKVYFIWVTRTQKSFEWMTEVIREVEDTDSRQVVDTHIFITQFKQKYDLRTTMLYICERHFQKVEGRSLFTGLKATTHFGRPDFVEFLYSLQLEHPQVRRFGVFSCGPGPMTSSVQAACTTLNKTDGYTYTHHYENF